MHIIATINLALLNKRIKAAHEGIAMFEMLIMQNCAQ